MHSSSTNQMNSSIDIGMLGSYYKEEACIVWKWSKVLYMFLYLLDPALDPRAISCLSTSST